MQRKRLSAEAIISQSRQDHPLWDEVEFPPFAQAKLQVSPHVVQFDLEPAKPWWEIVSVLQCPVLLLTGDAAGDVAITPEIAQEIGSLNPQLQIVRLAGAGHNVRREQFAEYCRLVREFLAGP